MNEETEVKNEEKCSNCGRSDDNCVCGISGHLDNPFLSEEDEETSLNGYVPEMY